MDSSIIPEDMRATRNASKSTPPPAKKSGKGTPAGKGTPKKEDIPKAEAEPAAAPDVNEEAVKATEPSDTDASDVSKKEKAEVSDVAVLEARKEQAVSDAVAEDPKELKSSKSIADEVSEEKVAPAEAKLETSEEMASDDPEKAVIAHEEIPPEPSTAETPTIDVKDVTEDGRDKKTSQEDEDEEMKEDLENNTEEQVENEEDDDVKNEEDEDNDDEEGDGEEGDDEEDDDELADERPVTESQKRKKFEVFVGGLDKEATVEDVKETFGTVGEVVEVRLMTHPQTGKNRGYAFVRFAIVDQAIRAATELDRTKIRDREIAVVPSEDNDTLFMGNVCKSWKSKQVQEKLKEYGIEGIDEMILVEDPDNEGQNRGHAFLEFATHNDAVKAFKRLSKPDAIFGCDRSARIGWAEGSSEPDEAVMAKVKSVFINGLPAEWDKEKIKEHFGKHGTIDRVVLAKNIPRSKRTDYAFVNFSTRDAAAAAIEALNEVELVDGDNKVKLKVELSKPVPRKRMKGHRGSYPVGGRPTKQKKGKGSAAGGGQSDRRRAEGGRAMSRGSQKKARGEKRKGADERPLPEEKSRDKHHRGPRVGSAVSKGGRGGRIGSSSRRGRPGFRSDDDYLPLGARISPGFGSAQGYSGHLPREAAYPQRAHRPGPKRSYSAADEEAAYYERDYPRPRMEYAEPALGGSSLYPDPIRAAPLGHSSLGHALPPVRGSHGYSSVLSGSADYNGYLPAAADPRGASYAANYYSSRTGSGYTIPGPYY